MITKNKEEKITLTGVSIVLGFSVVSLYLAFNPDYFGVKIIWMAIFLFSLFIALMGTIVELSKYFHNTFINKRINTDNFFAGFIFLILFFISKYIKQTNLFISFLIDTISIILLLFGCIGIIDGLNSIIKDTTNKKLIDSIKQNFPRIYNFILSIAGLIATIIAILESLDLL